MMYLSERYLKTGGDPRTLPDYAALRDELNKLTHPARPDVNWRDVEKRCLSLFEQNGVELQTTAWYTLARVQLAGLSGLNEGLAILEALINHQWGGLWPQPVQARMHILSDLSQRLQQLMRKYPLSYSDLSQLYRSEQLLTNLGAVLQRLGLKHLSQLDTLRILVYNSAVRLENSEGSSGAAIQPGAALYNTVPNHSEKTTDTLPGIPVAEKNEQVYTLKWVYKAQAEHQPNVAVLMTTRAPVKPWKSFAAGMCIMLVISVVMMSGWQYLHRPDSLQTQLSASLAPLPVILSSVQLEALRHQTPLPKVMTENTRQQLTRLEQMPVDWSIVYSRHLLQQAQALWPEQAAPLVLEWQQRFNGAVLPPDNLNGWHQGMTKLQQLSNRLNGLDEQKGKYITVSELKSVVFSTMQSFNQAIPAEEQLRVLSQNYAGQPLPSAAKAQMEIHLKQLIGRYALMAQSGARGSLIQQKTPDE